MQRYADARDPQGRDEQTLDRELDELTGGLRTAVPGVTVLLAFLLSVPFAPGFLALDERQQGAYFAAVLSTSLAVVFRLGEAAHHRLRAKSHHNGRLIKTAGRQLVGAGAQRVTVPDPGWAPASWAEPRPSRTS